MWQVFSVVMHLLACFHSFRGSRIASYFLAAANLWVVGNLMIITQRTSSLIENHLLGTFNEKNAKLGEPVV